MLYTECRNNRSRSIVVIGASAGGISTLLHIVSALKSDLDAAVFIVQHLAPSSPSLLDELLGNKSPLTVCFARDTMSIKPGCIYVAPPDHHLFIEDGFMRLSRGPRINLSRPAIDPLFFSAAVAYQSCVVGVVLSGMLDDGAAGLAAIKSCGGMTIVQTPSDALYKDMPQNAIDADQPDFIVPLSEITSTIITALHTSHESKNFISDNIRKELSVMKNYLSSSYFDTSGELSAVSCPECGGPMREKNVNVQQRYHCHIGHVFTAKWLLHAQDQALEASLWTAARTMKERARIQRKLAESERQANRATTEAHYQRQAKESEEHAQRLIDFIMQAKQVTKSP